MRKKKLRFVFHQPLGRNGHFSKLKVKVVRNLFISDYLIIDAMFSDKSFFNSIKYKMLKGQG